MVSGIQPRTFWYNFRNDGDDPVYFEHNMGIITQELQPKPAYGKSSLVRPAMASQRHNHFGRSSRSRLRAR